MLYLYKYNYFCCILAKFEEQEIQTPKCMDLNRYVAPESYTKWEYLQMEITLLTLFQWNISLPTAAHFIGYFLTVGVTKNDLHGDTSISLDCDRAKTHLQRYTDYFLEICLQGSKLNLQVNLFKNIQYLIQTVKKLR